MCIKSNKKCPVTDIHFLPKSSKNVKGYVYKQFNSKFKIGYSRTFDALPITMIKMEENKPCHLHWYTSLAQNSLRDRFYLNDFIPRKDMVDLSTGKYSAGKI